MSTSVVTDGRFTSSDASERGKKGRHRTDQIKAGVLAEIAQLTKDLLASLDRRPGPLDIVAAEGIAACHVRARRQRAMGKSDRAEMTLLVRMLQASGMRLAPASQAPADAV